MQDTRKVRANAKCCHLALYSRNFCSSFMTFHFCLDAVFSVFPFLWLWEGILLYTRPSCSVCVGGKGRWHTRVQGRSDGRCAPAAPRPAHCELSEHSQCSSEQKHKVALLLCRQVSSTWIISKSKQTALEVETAPFWSTFESPLDANCYSQRYWASRVTPIKLWYTKGKH